MKTALSCLAFWILGSFLTSCITIIDNPNDLPFDDKLVIRAVIQAGQPIENIQISRTLPTLSAFSDSAFAVTNALGSIMVDGQTFPLRLQYSTDSGRPRTFYAAPDLIAQAGKTYTLAVQWNNGGKILQATAQTRVPNAPSIQSAKIMSAVRVNFTTATIVTGAQAQLVTQIDTLPYSEISIVALPNVSYMAGLRVVSASLQPLSPLYNGTLVQQDSIGNLARIISTETLPPHVFSFLKRSSEILLQVSVSAFDKDYYPYYLSRSRGQQVSNLLGGTNGENVVWNIKGDGIGLFVGVATTTKIIMP